MSASVLSIIYNAKKEHRVIMQTDQQSGLANLTYRETWSVTFSDPSATAEMARNAVWYDGSGKVIAFIPRQGQTSPENSGAICRYVDASVDAQCPLLWHVTVEYATQQLNIGSAAGVNVQVRSILNREPTYLTGTLVPQGESSRIRAPIVNSAGDYYDPPEETSFYDWQISLSWTASSPISPGTVFPLLGKVCDSGGASFTARGLVFNLLARQLKLVDCNLGVADPKSGGTSWTCGLDMLARADQPVPTAGAGGIVEIYWIGTGPIGVTPGSFSPTLYTDSVIHGFTSLKPNVGYNGFQAPAGTAGNLSTYKKQVLLDARQVPFAQAQKLDCHGLPLGDPNSLSDADVWWVCPTDPEASFAPLIALIPGGSGAPGRSEPSSLIPRK